MLVWFPDPSALRDEVQRATWFDSSDAGEGPENEASLSVCVYIHTSSDLSCHTWGIEAFHPGKLVHSWFHLTIYLERKEGEEEEGGKGQSVTL